MKSNVIKTALCTLLALGTTATLAFAAESKINNVMKAVMKGDTSTYKLVCTGKGTPADAEKLAKCLKGLAGTKPPKGDSAAWDKKVKELIQAADDVVANKPNASQTLAKAGNCKACHSEHKGK